MKNFVFLTIINSLYARNLEGDIELTHEQIADIRDNFCGQLANRNSEFCTKDDEIPDWIWDMHKDSVRLCKQYYNDFHNIEQFSKTTVRYLAAGAQGMVSLWILLSNCKIYDV